jgi:CRP-like cAMP-binding protein
MSDSYLELFADHPAALIPAGAVLLHRGSGPAGALFVESGRVSLGLAGPASLSGLEHQWGTVEGPAWLEVNAAVLDLPSAVDAIAETDVRLRQIPMPQFRQALAGAGHLARELVTDVSRAHRRQTELAVSRLAKDAEARCAEWLLSHAETQEKGGWAVKLQQHKRLIAAQLGIAPETLSRVLRHLRERCLISGSGRTVQLVDPGGLRLLAES